MSEIDNLKDDLKNLNKSHEIKENKLNNVLVKKEDKIALLINEKNILKNKISEMEENISVLYDEQAILKSIIEEKDKTINALTSKE